MKLAERISAFASLGYILNEALEGTNKKYSEKIESLISRQQNINPWFTPENVRLALKSIAASLKEDKLRKWTGKYPELNIDFKPVKVGVIMAGNIPLVGFHDFLSVLITGNRLIARTSSKDPELPVAMAEILYEINDEFRDMIEFSDGIIKDFDAVIATGSSNTSRYFEYYFGKYHNLIRKNRNSIAIITGNEDCGEIEKLGEDIFSYFGLGCRNVSKLFIPEDYDPDSFRKHWEKYSGIINHTKYGNNYDYYKAIYLVNKEVFYDNGFFLMKEDRGYASPVSVIYFEYYRRDEDFSFLFGPDKDKIQCVVG
ncbi:MAG: acyl-CoA reductase, partial [Bacteroidales bacterium]